MRPRISREIAEGSINSTTSVRNRFYDYIDPHAVSAVNDYRSSFLGEHLHFCLAEAG